MPINPQRGEIWRLNFDPQIGNEIQKTRPAVVLDQGHPALSLRIVVPVTEWKAAYANSIAKIHIKPNRTHGLSKESAADAYQIKIVDLKRFQSKLGILPQAVVDDIASAVATFIDAP